MFYVLELANKFINYNDACFVVIFQMSLLPSFHEHFLVSKSTGNWQDLAPFKVTLQNFNLASLLTSRPSTPFKKSKIFTLLLKKSTKIELCHCFLNFLSDWLGVGWYGGDNLSAICWLPQFPAINTYQHSTHCILWHLLTFLQSTWPKYEKRDWPWSACTRYRISLCDN